VGAKRQKVLFLPSWYPTSANPVNGIFVKKHAEAAARFCDIAVLYIKNYSNSNLSKFSIQHRVENGIITLRVGFKTSSLPVVGRLLNLARRLKAIGMGLAKIYQLWGKPDIAHLQIAWPAGIIALYLNFVYGLPYILTEHWSGYTASSADFKKSSLLMKLATKIIFRKAKILTAVSRFLANSIRAHNLPYAKLVTVPNVVNIPSKERPKPKTAGAMRILTVSMLYDRSKNISGLLKALAETVQKRPDIRLDILGDGKDRTSLTSLAKDLGLLDKNVFFQGYVPNNELANYFMNAHFFVLNSNYETFSVATIEALAHGLPVVVTKCGGPEEFVTNTVGVLVNRKDRQSLVDGLGFMLENWHKYNPADLRDYVKLRFSPEAVGRQFYRIYEDLLKEN